MIKITGLNIYPVKSLRGIALEKATLGVRGLAFDRQWMVVDSDYRFVTQRQIPSMAQIETTLTGSELILSHPNGGELSIMLASSKQPDHKAVIWGDECLVIDEGDAAAEWLTHVLGTRHGSPLRLVRFPEDFRRQVDVDYLQGEDAHTAFADGFPFLVAAEASLAALNQTLSDNHADPVPMHRFRPNIILRGTAPFEENQLITLEEADGRYALGIRKPCLRCKVTTVDQAAGVVPDVKEPLRTLAEMQTVPEREGAFFGQNATLLAGIGTPISVGDVLSAIKK